MKPIFEQRPLPAEASFIHEARQGPAFPFYWHAHANYELTFITAGYGQRFVGDHIGPYRAGDLVLVGEHLPHTWVSAAAETTQGAVFIQFGKDFLGEDFFTRPETVGVARLLERAQRGLVFSGRTAAAAGRHLIRLAKERGLPRLLRLLWLLQQLADDRTAEPLASSAYAAESRPGDQDRLEQALAYVDAHLTEKISFHAVAGELAMSRSTFARFFQRGTGKTWVEYVNSARLARACSLLADTDLPVGEIAGECGFVSLPYFNRRFLKEKGLTPLAYRRARNRG